MEGLEQGWVRSDISGNYHYVNAHINRDDMVTSPCGFRTRKFSQILKKFEILDTTLICTMCEISLQRYRINSKKKQQLEEINQINITDDSTLQEVICSEPSCNETGIAFVSSQKEHYCIKHNLKVQQIIKQLEVIP